MTISWCDPQARLFVIRYHIVSSRFLNSRGGLRGPLSIGPSSLVDDIELCHGISDCTCYPQQKSTHQLDNDSEN